MKLCNLNIHTFTWPDEYGHLQKEDPSAWIWMVSYSVISVRGCFNCLLILSVGAGCSSYFISVSFAPTAHDPWEHCPLSYLAPHSLLFSRYRGLCPRSVGCSSYPLAPFSKGKAVPLQAWSGPEGSRKLRFPDYTTTAQDGGKVVSLTQRPPLSPGNIPGTHFC